MIQNPHRDFPVVDERVLAEPVFQGWIQSVTELLNFFEVMEGSGSPEGIVKAKAKKYYFDTVGAALYFKTTNETLDTGWIQLG
jgi:hypothetical protein